MTKRKNKKANKPYKSKNEVKTLKPETFFRKIGIGPIKRERVINEFEKAGLKGFISYHQCNSDLKLAKIWWGGDFDMICLIANELSRLHVPSNSRILDVGGGTGHIAFWLSHIWPDCQITVADKYSNVGIQWAQEIGTDKVTFIDDQLPEMKNIGSDQYDVVLLSRVLANTNEFILPSSFKLDWDDFSLSQDGKNLICSLEKIAAVLNRVMKSNGKLIVIDSWSDDRILLVGKIFENKDLYINLDLFDFHRVNIKYSSIVFSKSSIEGPLRDIPMALATMITLGYDGAIFKEIAAQSLKKLFDENQPLMEFEYYASENNASCRHEIFEKYGLGIIYRTTSEGARMSSIFSAIDIPTHIESYRKMEEEIKGNGKDKIVQSVTVR